MTKQRALTQLTLAKVNFFGGAEGYVEVEWGRADGSRGKAVFSFTPYRAERWRVRDIYMRDPTAEKLRDVPVARIEAAVSAHTDIHEWLDEANPPAIKPGRRERAAKRRRLQRPAGRKLSPEFFKQVADAYQDAVANGLPPTRTLAQDSDTPPGTVNRWIATARHKYKHLPDPEEPGEGELAAMTSPADQREELRREARARLKRAWRDYNKIHALAQRHPDDAFFRSEEERMRTYLQLLLEQEGADGG